MDFKRCELGLAPIIEIAFGSDLKSDGLAILMGIDSKRHQIPIIRDFAVHPGKHGMARRFLHGRDQPFLFIADQLAINVELPDLELGVHPSAIVDCNAHMPSPLNRTRSVYPRSGKKASYTAEKAENGPTSESGAPPGGPIPLPRARHSSIFHPMPTHPRRPELLSPVGDMDMCMAAVHNGADAVYVGYPGFNARGRTVDHGWDVLEEMIAFCHGRKVKVFLALNILLFEKELRLLAEDLPRALRAGVDAFIVQDLGLARLIRFMSPAQVLHASTQMTVSNHEAISLTEDLDLARYVLAREVSLPEMKLIRAATDKELEVFVHGALCVSYSGQCLTSEGFGGRSANRGQCAQSCRMEYDLWVDGERRDLGARRYLVSPKDLCGLDESPALIEAGIDSFKIEGRLKTPQYVAATASAYVRAMDGASPVAREARDDLQITYSRGFFNGWLEGVDHQRLVDGRYGSHRGLEIGIVTGRMNGSLRIKSCHPLRAGDGLLIVADPAGDGRKGGAWGGRIFS